MLASVFGTCNAPGLTELWGTAPLHGGVVSRAIRNSGLHEPREPDRCLSVQWTPPERATGRRRSPRLDGSFVFFWRLFVPALLCFPLPGIGSEEDAKAKGTGSGVDLDVQLGYHGIARVGTWFPVRIDVRNAGPSLRGVLAIEPEVSLEALSRTVVLELPQGTRKRLETVAFCHATYQRRWEIRLSAGGKRTRPVTALEVSTRKVLSVDTPWALVLGRRFPSPLAGLSPPAESDAPVWTSIRPEDLPDSPLLWEAIDGLYLSSAQAVNVTPSQVSALGAWVHRGGHLLVGFSDVADLDHAPWLGALLPVEISHMVTLTGAVAAVTWAQPQTGVRTAEGPPVVPSEDQAIQPTVVPLGQGSIRDGEVRAWWGDQPLVVTSRRGSGRVTVVLTDLERQPWSDWALQGGHWNALWEWPSRAQTAHRSSHRIQEWSRPEEEMLLGLLQTDQIRSLPWGWVLALVVVYVVLIGPVDYRWTRRSRRPILTWLRLPVYAVLFAGVIYGIGYWHRAGVSEWNELNVVDVDLSAPKALWRGWTFVSLYSPRTGLYPVGAAHAAGGLRSAWAERGWGWDWNQRSVVQQVGAGWEGELYVPIWTSRNWVYDWYAELEVPVEVHVEAASDQWTVEIRNRLPQSLTQVHLVVESAVFPLQSVGPLQTLRETTAGRAGEDRDNMLGRVESRLNMARLPRGWPSGGNKQRPLWCEGATAVSLGLRAVSGGGSADSPLRSLGVPLASAQSYVWLLVWVEEHRPLPMTAQFQPTRLRYGTLYRIRVPVSLAPIPSHDTGTTS
jgi:hypothetical protein